MTATKAGTNGHLTAAERDARMLKLEEDVRTLTWLLAEVSMGTTKMAHALAALLAQQLQPQMHQAILQQLMGVNAPSVGANLPTQ